MKDVYNKKHYLMQFLHLPLFIKQQILWRKSNFHNFTEMGNLFYRDRVTVGRGTYGKLNVYTYSRDDTSMLVIGNFCSIASTSKFLLGGGHILDTCSTYPFKKMYLGIAESISKGDIIIDDDVWIGENAIILSGVHIGQGAVIGTGAIVTKDVQPYAIVAGIPASVIRYRFNEEKINKLIKIDFSKLSSEWIKDNIELLYSSVDDTVIDKILIELKNHQDDHIKYEI